MIPENSLHIQRIFWVLLLGTFLLSSCYKFDGDQTIPAYLEIDTVSISTYYPEQGSATHNITDVWVYVNDGLVGVFEMPAKFPVLARGTQKLRIAAGIKLNGISSTRVPYPYYKPIIYESFDFYEDSVIILPESLKTEYYDNLVFGWKEDFETSGLTMQEIETSDTVIKRTQEGLDPAVNLSYAGVVNLTNEKPIWSSYTINSYPMPSQGDPVLLEIDYKTDNYFNVGLLIKEQGTFIKIPLLIINHSETWNKIYVNLGPNLSLHPNGSEYQVILEAGLQSDKSNASIYMDNIKLIYRP